MARTATKTAAAGAAAIATPPPTGSEYDFPLADTDTENEAALAGKPLERVGDIFGDDDDDTSDADEKPAARDRGAAGKRKAPAGAAQKKGAAPPSKRPQLPAAGAAALLDAGGDGDETEMFMAMLSNLKQSKLQERRKKSAAIVSEAKNALNALKRQLETATAKASSSGIGEAQQKRMEEWTTELEKLEAGVEKTIAKFKADIHPQTEAMNALRAKIAGMTEVGAWSSPAAPGGDFDAQVKKIEKQAAAVAAAAEKKIEGLQKEAKDPGKLKRIMEMAMAEFGSD